MGLFSKISSLANFKVTTSDLRIIFSCEVFRKFEYNIFVNILIWSFQYFEHIEEMEWAIEVCKETGMPVAASMCIGPLGDLHGVSSAECAVRMARAGAHVGEHTLLFTFNKSLY